MMQRILALLFSFFLVFSAPAADLPDLGDVAVSDLSPATERRIGEEIMRDIRRDPAYLDDPEVEEYVNRLGTRLAAASHSPHLSFSFFVVNDSTLNAFALPGGYIGVHSGLLLTAESESELASVLAHEIAHVTQRHIAQTVGKQGEARMMILASLLAAILVARSDSQMGEAVAAAGQAGALQSQLGYSRNFEREADRVGLQTLNSAGFDVRGMPSFFERLQRATRVYENNAPAYLRTHPLTSERIADMENRAVSMPYKQIADSNDFRFVRGKLRSREGQPVDALKAAEHYVEQVKNDFAVQYGLVRAQLRAGRLDAAESGLNKLRQMAPASSFIETLAAEIALARKDIPGAVKGLERAFKQFPSSIAVQYVLADARIQAGMPDVAQKEIRQELLRRPADQRLWQLSARANAVMGKRTAQHRAQAEVYALAGSWSAAIEQLELALKANDGDFYELSAIDARLRELKMKLDEEKQNRS